MRLVWSQPTRPTSHRARHVLLLSILCLFLGGTLVGAAGRDPREAPRALRAAIASLLSTGGVFLLVAGAEAFKALSLPPFAAYLCVGLLGLIASFRMAKLPDLAPSAAAEGLAFG